MAPTAVAVTLPRPAEGPVPEGGELVFGARASSAGLPLYGAPPAQRAPARYGGPAAGSARPAAFCTSCGAAFPFRSRYCTT